MKSIFRYGWAGGLCALAVGNALASDWSGAVSRTLSGETMLKASTHFDIRYKHQNDDGSANNPSYNETQLTSGLSTLEDVWVKFHDQMGFMEPEATSIPKNKVRVYLYATIDALYGGADQYGPAMWLGVGALTDRWGLSHEYTHGLQSISGGLRDSKYTGWFHESHANWMAHQFQPSNVHCSEMLVNYPYLYYGSTRNRYCNWQYLEHLKEAYGTGVVNDIWTKSLRQYASGYRDETPFTALMRNRGWSVSDFNDDFGHFAMRSITWDYSNGATYRSSYGSYTDRHKVRRNRVTMLDSLDASRKRFVSPSYWSPQALGYNLVRLYPDTTGRASTITVRFRGIAQSTPTGITYGSYQLEPSAVTAPASDWRWGVVAVAADGSPRYSALQSGATADLQFALKSNDQSLWMVVAATPSVYQRIFWDQIYYSIYRYPWRVELDGASPEGFQPGAWDPPAGVTGRAHANGGGFVASTATVAATAYVAPHARVLGRAQVLGNARLEGFAQVGDNAVVSENAVIRDQGRVLGSGRVYGSAIVEEHASVYSGEVYGSAMIGALTLIDGGKVYGQAKVYSVMNALGVNQSLSGTAQMRGDTEYNFSAVSSGVFYGIVNDQDAKTANYGANRTAPAAEVTSTLIPAWPAALSSSSSAASSASRSSSSVSASSSSAARSSSSQKAISSSAAESSSSQNGSSSSAEEASSGSGTVAASLAVVARAAFQVMQAGDGGWWVQLPPESRTLRLISARGALLSTWRVEGRAFQWLPPGSLPAAGMAWLEVRGPGFTVSAPLWRSDL